ncbi:MAG: hypothetical protein F4X72_09690 [Dehalococcoidia bacterium]|nr:hypothetical protein [Dehalococcoidia bacterium]
MATAITDIGSRRELFVDNFLIESLNGARLKLQEPRPGGVAIEYDQPWEREPAGSRSFYTSVIKDGDIYRMYYRGDMTYSCYAESTDGINWTKPSLGLVEVEGSTENNAIVKGRPLYPFVDGRAGVPDSERYKANSYVKGGLAGHVSSDGIHWRKLRDEVIVPGELVNHFDANSVMFWSEVEDLYLLYTRHMEGGRRATARATSEDFVNWTGPTLMEYSNTGTTTPSEHLYTNQTQPYFRAPHIYISMPGRIFFADERHISREDDIAFARTRVITEEVRRFYDAEVGEKAGGVGDVADGVFLTSRAGSTTYDFTFRESFVRPGIGLSNWTTRNNYPACGVVQTGPTEMSLYVNRNYGQKTAYLERMTLRLDGFTSLNAPYDGGEMTTRPFTFSGKQLEINYSTSAAGSIRVELQDAEGRPVPGHGLNECRELVGDEIARSVAWERGCSVSDLAGRPVRLRFVMKDADLYSLRFQP